MPEVNVEKATLKRVIHLYESNSLNSTYNFRKIINDCVTGDEVSERVMQYRSWSHVALAEIILYKFFDIKEYDEKKYIEIHNMPINELYEKMAIKCKQIKMAKKLNTLAKDFE